MVQRPQFSREGRGEVQGAHHRGWFHLPIVSLLLMLIFSLPVGHQAWASDHFDDAEEAAEDTSWRDTYAAGSRFAAEYADNRNYVTRA